MSSCFNMLFSFIRHGSNTIVIELFADFMIHLGHGAYPVYPVAPYAPHYWCLFFRCLCYHQDSISASEDRVVQGLETRTDCDFLRSPLYHMGWHWAEFLSSTQENRLLRYSREQLSPPQNCEGAEPVCQNRNVCNGDEMGVVFPVMGTKGTEASWQALKPLLERHILFTKASAEQHHAFSHEEVRRHAGWLDFDRLSGNYDIQWTEGLIEEFADRWDWDQLSYSALMMRSDNLSDEFVKRFQDRWDPFVLDGGLDDDPDPAPSPNLDSILAEMEDKGLLPSPTELARKKDLMEGAWTASRISAEVETIDFSLLSQNPSLGWSVKLLTKYEDRWNWDSLAWHPRLWSRVMRPHKDALLELLLECSRLVLVHTPRQQHAQQRFAPETPLD